MKKSAQKTQATTQKFIEILDISENIAILPYGNACLIIEVIATNFSLFSKEEQDAKIFAYSTLLNSLSFPIQIFISSKRVDISSYIKLLDWEEKKTQNEKLAHQIGLYKEFIKELVKINTVLDKKFYIVIPYSYLEKGPIQQGSFVLQAKTALLGKAQVLLSQLATLNLRARTLAKEELVKLYYEIYNADLGGSSNSEENVNTTFVKGTKEI